MSWVETSEATVTAAHDLARGKPYAVNRTLISPQAIEQAMYPEQLLLLSVFKLRDQVNELVAQQHLTPDGNAGLALVWVQPVQPRTEEGD